MMDDKEMLLACSAIIQSHPDRTTMDYKISAMELAGLSTTANTEFQRACIQAAGFTLWEPDTLNLCCLFE